MVSPLTLMRIPHIPHTCSHGCVCMCANIIDKVSLHHCGGRRSVVVICIMSRLYFSACLNSPGYVVVSERVIICLCVCEYVGAVGVVALSCPTSSSSSATSLIPEPKVVHIIRTATTNTLTHTPHQLLHIVVQLRVHYQHKLVLLVER